MAQELFTFPQSDDLLKDSLEWQHIIDQAPKPAKDELGRQACEALFGRTVHVDTRRVIAKADTVIVLPASKANVRKQTDVLQFGAVHARGHQGNIEYLRIGKEGILTVPIYDAQVLDAQILDIGEADITELDPEVYASGRCMPAHEPSRLPFQLPVGLIDYVIPAAA